MCVPKHGGQMVVCDHVVFPLLPGAVHGLTFNVLKLLGS